LCGLIWLKKKRKQFFTNNSVKYHKHSSLNSLRLLLAGIILLSEFNMTWFVGLQFLAT